MPPFPKILECGTDVEPGRAAEQSAQKISLRRVALVQMDHARLWHIVYFPPVTPKLPRPVCVFDIKKISFIKPTDLIYGAPSRHKHCSHEPVHGPW